MSVREIDITLGATRYGLMLYTGGDGCAGRGFSKYGEYSESEVEVFRRFGGQRRLALDVGGNIGAHALAMARIFREVYSFEKDPILSRILAANMVLNELTNVRVVAGLAQDGLRELGLLEDLDFVKIDVDGPELEVLEVLRPSIELAKPTLYVENDVPAASEAKIGWLVDLGYDVYWHLAGLYSVGNWLGVPVDECDAPNASMMMLAVPTGTAVPALKRAKPGQQVMRVVGDRVVFDLGAL